MLLNSHTSDEKCSDPESESDNFSVDSLEAEAGSSMYSKNTTYRAHKLSNNESMSLNQNYGDNKTKSHELPFESGTEQFIEANLSIVDIVLPSEPYVKQNGKTKFERKSVGKVCQRRPLLRRSQSVSKTRYQNEDNQTSAKETIQFKPKTRSPRSLSSDSASLQAHTSHRSQGRKTFAKLTPTNKSNKRSVSYLEQYRGQNPLYQAQGNEDSNMNESPSQVSVITSQDDESQFYSDLINGRINECGQSGCDANGTCDHGLASVSSQDLKSVSEVRPLQPQNAAHYPVSDWLPKGLGGEEKKIQFARSQSSNYVPYTGKDLLLVLPTNLGSLGPDPSSYKEKAESCKKRQQYGMSASLKNLEMIRHRNLKKKIAKSIADLHPSASREDFRRDEQWEINSNYHSSSSSKVEVHHDSAEISKKQPKYGCGKFKKKPPPDATNIKTSGKEIKVEKTESNLDLINKLLRERHKNELIINTF